MTQNAAVAYRAELIDQIKTDPDRKRNTEEDPATGDLARYMTGV